jgi:hypothetical protein
VVGAGDFDGDGKFDLFWRHTSGANYVWLMNGATLMTPASRPGVADANWEVASPKSPQCEPSVRVLAAARNLGLRFAQIHAHQVINRQPEILAVPDSREHRRGHRHIECGSAQPAVGDESK